MAERRTEDAARRFFGLELDGWGDGVFGVRVGVGWAVSGPAAWQTKRAAYGYEGTFGWVERVKLGIIAGSTVIQKANQRAPAMHRSAV